MNSPLSLEDDALLGFLDVFRALALIGGGQDLQLVLEIVALPVDDGDILCTDPSC